jgi:uncharacterized protein (DUF1684 family)
MDSHHDVGATPPQSLRLSIGDYLDLADYRRQVFAQYEAARTAPNPEQAWATWRQQRDELFIHHRQSPLEPATRSESYATPFAPYDLDFRVTARPRPVGGEDLAIDHADKETTLFRPIALVDVSIPTGEFELTLYWLAGYGGGIFLPFRDATAGGTTYGAGRYLLDTVKGADLGVEDEKLVLDFNYAYHPSCVYSSRWSCPLAPPPNRVNVSIPAGEQLQPAIAGGDHAA